MTAKIAARIAATATLAVMAAASAAAAFEQGRIQDISMSSRHGASAMSQFYTPDAPNVPHAKTRVCLVNLGARERIFTHAVAGIDPMRAAPGGGKSCANFPAGARVAFGMQDGGEPATSGVAMVMSLGAFEDGIVTFVWN